MHGDLLRIFNSIARLSPEEKELITKAFKPMSLTKGAFFLKEGEMDKYIGFIKTGLVRYFVYKNDEEATFEFTKEGEFIADYQSFNNHIKTVQNIQAIENCELLVINYEDVQYIFNNIPHGNLLGRIIIEHRFDVMVGQLLSIYMHNQEERYKKFMANYTDLAQRIPQYLIASYVGVKPQSLSRIRKRFAQ
ncbi:MAG: Crp/Fnr family transcriptional regulator [Chitinophagaceae bacterium]|nr:Crp/Fnr family transcriptional regulator [Chitinophagaceae bacterium]